MDMLPELVDPMLFQKPDAGDESLFPIFYMGVLKNEERTVAEGRPIYDDVECVRVIIPGDKNNVVDRPVRQDDKRRWPKQYELFKAGAREDEQISGTRLSDWPFLSRAQCEEYRYLGLRTVEQLAAVSDSVLSRVPGMAQLRLNAQVWLDKAKGAAEAAAIAKELLTQNSRIDELNEVVRDQARIIEEMKRERALGKHA